MRKCRECGMKHLAAALAYAKSGKTGGIVWVLNDSVVCLVSQAYVLASESAAYPDHYAAAIGFLVMAEEAAYETGQFGTEVTDEIRSIRLGSRDAASLMRSLRRYPLCEPFVGHLREAVREGSAELPEQVSMDWFEEHYGEIAKATWEKEPPAPPVEPDRKGGETIMATKCGKKCASKCGSTKCATKGGKAKKGCCGKKGCK